jgi:hypothetical protein
MKNLNIIKTLGIFSILISIYGCGESTSSTSSQDLSINLENEQVFKEKESIDMNDNGLSFNNSLDIKKPSQSKTGKLYISSASGNTPPIPPIFEEN